MITLIRAFSKWAVLVHEKVNVKHIDTDKQRFENQSFVVPCNTALQKSSPFKQKLWKERWVRLVVAYLYHVEWIFINAMQRIKSIYFAKYFFC